MRLIALEIVTALSKQEEEIYVNVTNCWICSDQHAPVMEKKFTAGIPAWIDDENKRSRKLRRKYERK